MVRVHKRTCHLCEAMCGVEVELEGERVLSIRGDREDVLSQGHVCPKVQGLEDVHEDPDRLRTPQKRVGDRWYAVPWEEALDEAATRLNEVRTRSGAQSLAVFLGNPIVHNYGTMLSWPLLRSALGRPGVYSATSLDQLPHMLASHLMFGHQLRLPVPDVDRSDFLLMFGANPLVSNGSLMSGGDIAGRLAQLRERGGRIVVVDPRRTETARVADQHVAIRPGGDALLLLAIVREVFVLGAVAPGRLSAHLDGLDRVRALSEPFTPEAVAPVTGVRAEVTRGLARDFCAATRPVAYGRVGLCTQEFGGLGAWLINVLNTITGRLDEPGGAMFASPAIPFPKGIGRGSFGRRSSRVRGVPGVGGELPSATLAEEIDTPGAGQVRALVTLAGNPVLSTPHGARLDAALPGLDFMVSVDIYRNETTRHADLILPPTFGLEHDHYDLAFHLLTVRNTAKYSPAAFERAAEARHDWEILLGLAARLRGGKLGRLVDHAPRALGRWASPQTLLDLLLRVGPYGVGRGGLSLRALRDAPAGVDLGPLKPIFPRALSQRRIQLAPAAMVADVARARQRLAGDGTEAPLVLIGRRELRTNNSWMHNAGKLNRGRRRCTLQVHPDDARGLLDGQPVCVRSRAGSVTAELEITDAVMPGVVSLPHGWGHHREGAQLRVAAQRPGVSVNDVTDELRVDPLTGTAAFNGVPVTLEAIDPPVVG